MISEFKNEQYLDFSKDENKAKMKSALEKIEKSFGKEYPIYLDGEDITTGRWIESVNPSNKNQIVGKVAKSDIKLTEKALDIAYKTFETWKYETAEKRADYLFKIANYIRENKYEFSATMVYEVGKSWAEADGDTAEAIDFCEFYAREALRYNNPPPCVPYPGEKNECVYIPLGVGVVIPPWNFPLAILVGMTTAAMVTGNTVIVKPASDSPVIAAKFMEAVKASGLPKGVINFLPGSGAEVGDVLVKSSKTRFISFTGSMDVGLHIAEETGKVYPGQKWIKRLVAEMGGKDAIIVDDKADLDAAAKGVAMSAYGFQGQKCSACSRAIVVDSIHDEFIKKLLKEVEDIQMGPTNNFENKMGPVISQKAFNSIMKYIEVGRGEGKLLIGGEGDDREGFFIQPTVFDNIDRNARLAQEEIFGPVLAVIRAKNFDDAISVANNTFYGLTGGVFTKDKDRIEKAKKEFFAGNLYINRKCTGALVGVQPFGGYNMSGTCSKAGGKDYLLLFMQAKSITEKL